MESLRRRLAPHVYRLQQAAYHHGSVAHITQTAVIDGVNIRHWVMAPLTPPAPTALQPRPAQEVLETLTASRHNPQ